VPTQTHRRGDFRKKLLPFKFDEKPASFGCRLFSFVIEMVFQNIIRLMSNPLKQSCKRPDYFRSAQIWHNQMQCPMQAAVSMDLSC
jgi:hypothetical protein